MAPERWEEGTLINYGLSAIHFESDIINLAASGTEWLSNPISSGNSQAIIADLPSPVQGASFNFQTRLRGHSSSISSSCQSTAAPPPICISVPKSNEASKATAAIHIVI